MKIRTFLRAARAVLICFVLALTLAPLRPDEAVADEAPAPSSIRHDARKKYWPKSYRRARAKFRGLARRQRRRYENVELGRIPVPSDTDRNLTIDYVHIPARGDAEKLFVAATGIHGTEGFVGSAILQLFMREILPDLDLTNTGVLLIHGINPWGMKHQRQVDEANVDLNRNFTTQPELYQFVNEGYALLDPFLNRTGPVDLTEPSNVNYQAEMMALLDTYGFEALQAAVILGQYQFPEGIYYGGDSARPQVQAMQDLLLRVTAPYDSVFLLDFHTAFGPWGELVLFQTPVEDETWLAARDAIFEGYAVPPAPYVPYGDFTVFLMELMLAQPGKVYVPMTIEYGTADNHELSGMLETVQIMRLEGQGHHHGYARREDQRAVRKMFRGLFQPDDKAWRQSVMEQTAEMWPVLMDRFIGLE